MASDFELFSSFSSVDEVVEHSNNIQESDRLRIAQKAVDIVIGANFAGVHYESTNLPDVLRSTASENLAFGCNRPYVKAKCLEYLSLAKILLCDKFEKLDNAGERLAFSVLLLWQKILLEPSVELKEKISVISNDLLKASFSDDEWTRFYLEKAEAHLIFYEYEEAENSIMKALEYSGVDVELAGRLGKRTRFQQKAVSQLVLNTTTTRTSSAEDDDIPPNVSLNDDTLLEKVSLLEGVETSSLTEAQLAVVLALCRLEKRSQHNDELLQEKCNAYLDVVLGRRLCWPVQMAALLMRSDMEKNRKRKVERACSQAEYCVKLMDGIEDKTSMEKRWNRCLWVLASGLEPIWNAKVVYAAILRSLGCTSEALLIFEHLEMWDHVIDCYKSLEQLEKANSLIHRLLEERPTDSMLYVYLGDINQQPNYYEKAIELSNDRNARARKSLGQMLLFRGKYEEAYPHLRRSLELQPIQLGVWFNAGHCAWKLENYADSATCYHRCVSLEPDHFEAWNNLCAAYIRQGQKERAKRILQEALKFNYEHAKVWENYLLLCIDTGDFLQAIQSFHRLLDLNKRQQDDEVLGIMAKEVLRREKEESEVEDKSLTAQIRSELVKLFGRITSVQTLSGEVWRMYADLKRPVDDDITEFEKYVQLLERSVLSESNKAGWSKEIENCARVLSSAVYLANERLALANLKGSHELLKQTKSRIRMSLRPLLTIAEKDHQNSVDENLQLSISSVRDLILSISS